MITFIASISTCNELSCSLAVSPVLTLVMLELLLVWHWRSWFGLGRFSYVVFSIRAEYSLFLCSGNHVHVYLRSCHDTHSSINEMIRILCIFTQEIMCSIIMKSVDGTSQPNTTTLSKIAYCYKLTTTSSTPSFIIIVYINYDTMFRHVLTSVKNPMRRCCHSTQQGCKMVPFRVLFYPF